ncbi:MAG: DUF4339 domain-containing protein [Verrucomicrobiae bacterium]|nr:DUF4339 domain-containing protein [Verrucomicrobiae bacterium]
MSTEYYVFSDRQYGPYDAATVRGLVAAGRLAREAWVFHAGETEDWTRADNVPSLKAFFPIAETARGGARSETLAAKLDQARSVARIPAPSPMAGTKLLPSKAEDAVRRMEVQLPDAPLSDRQHPHESIQVLAPPPPPTPGRWLAVLQRIFGRKGPPA